MMTPYATACLLLSAWMLVLVNNHRVIAFVPLATIHRHSTYIYCESSSLATLHSSSSNNDGSDLKTEAAQLLEKARQLRDSLPEDPLKKEDALLSKGKRTSRWNVPESDAATVGVGYRLYLDIGREEGTWMDPKWGASGNRIEGSVDVKFLTDTVANQTIANRMVQDNLGGSKSSTYVLQTAPMVRLRNGFDEMPCKGGGFRIDTGRNGNVGTVRFYIAVDGTPETGSSYGDVSVPKGCLYFSIPCFGNSMAQLSSRDGLVTVRQIGWHTGWRREESRIVGTFRAVPIDKAQQRDGF